MAEQVDRIHTCSRCGTVNKEQQGEQNEYKCQQCQYELAHIDVASNGVVRGIFGWLKEKQALIGGRYQVETVLGKGGFGATYLVSDQRVQGKRWALKEIPEILFDEYEVSLLNQLDHASVPIIADQFIESGMVYLVLKFGGTKTLATICKQEQRISHAVLKPWIAQIGNVLAYLHSRTPPIIHRDLKPENILIDDEDRIMLIDFGIAKQTEQDAATRTLGRAASHGFSPPEQVMGTGTDVRSDIYSFAATVYYALTGTLPAAAHERVAGKPLLPVKELVSEIPETVNTALLKALSLNINDRQDSIENFLSLVIDVGPVDDSMTGEAKEENKTVRIDNIQFGPVIGESQDGAKMSLQDARQPGKELVSKKIVFTIALLLLAGLGGGIYLQQHNKDIRPKVVDRNIGISATREAALESNKNKSKVIGTIDTPSKSSAVKPSLQPGLSATDILKEGLKSREQQATTVAQQIVRKNKEVKKRPTRPIKRATKPAKRSTQPDWGNQQEGIF